MTGKVKTKKLQLGRNWPQERFPQEGLLRIPGSDSKLLLLLLLLDLSRWTNLNEYDPQIAKKFDELLSACWETPQSSGTNDYSDYSYGYDYSYSKGSKWWEHLGQSFASSLVTASRKKLEALPSSE